MAGPLATYFELVVIGIDILLGILMLRLLKGKETQGRVFFIGTILFFFTHAACRTLYWLDTVVVHDVTLNYIGTFLGLLCVEFIVIAIEMTVFKRSHHFFSIYGIAGLSVMAVDIFIRVEVAGMNLNIWAQTALLPVLAGLIILVFLNLAIKSVGRVRTAAIVMVIAKMRPKPGSVSSFSYSGNCRAQPSTAFSIRPMLWSSA